VFQDIFREARIKLATNFKTMAKISDKLKAIVNHQGFGKYFVNTSWLFAEKILRIIVGLFVGIYVARYLGPEKFGIFSYALAFVALFGAIAELGVGSVIVRDLVNHPQDRDIFLGTAFWLKTAGGVLALVIISIAARLVSDDPKTISYIFIIASGLLFQSFEVVDYYFQSKVLAKYVSMCNLFQLIFSSLLKLYFIFIGASLFWFVLVSLIDQALLAVSYIFAYWRQNIGIFFSHFKLRVAREVLGNSLPIAFSGLLTVLLFRIDQVMIRSILGLEAVGQYSVAVQLSEIWYFIPMVITGSFFPAVLNAQKNNQKLYHERLLRLHSLLTWIALCIILPMALFSDKIVSLLYGKVYNQSSQALTVLIWSVIFVFLGNASKRWFLAENLQHLLFVRTFLGLIINILLNIVLIPAYGIKGAAIATLISYAFTYYVSYLFNPKLRFLLILTTKSLNPKYLLNGWDK